MRSMDPTTVHDDEREVEREKSKQKLGFFVLAFLSKKDHLCAFSLYRNPFPNAPPEVTSGS